MLTMTNLSKVYRTEVVETYALRDFSIDVQPGEFVAVTGPSGSGKTTFLTIAGLLEEFTSGDYRLDGVDVRGLSDSKRSRLRNEKIGFIFQAFNLIPDLSVQDNVDVPLRYRRMPRGTAASARRWIAWGCRRARATIRRSSRAASSNVSRSRGHSPGIRACCSPMSPREISTRTWRGAWCSCSRSCTRTAPRSSW